MYFVYFVVHDRGVAAGSASPAKKKGGPFWPALTQSGALKTYLVTGAFTSATRALPTTSAILAVGLGIFGVAATEP